MYPPAQKINRAKQLLLPCELLTLQLPPPFTRLAQPATRRRAQDPRACNERTTREHEMADEFVSSRGRYPIPTDPYAAVEDSTNSTATSTGTQKYQQPPHLPPFPPPTFESPRLPRRPRLLLPRSRTTRLNPRSPPTPTASRTTLAATRFPRCRTEAQQRSSLNSTLRLSTLIPGTRSERRSRTGLSTFDPRICQMKGGFFPFHVPGVGERRRLESGGTRTGMQLASSGCAVELLMERDTEETLSTRGRGRLDRLYHRICETVLWPTHLPYQRPLSSSSQTSLLRNSALMILILAQTSTPVSRRVAS